MNFERINISSGAPLEEKIGYSRAVRKGPFVYIGGTTSTNPDGTVHGVNNPYAQAKNIFDKITAALEKAGAAVEDVVRVRMYVTDIKQAQEFMRAYAELFKPIMPVTLMCEVSRFFRPEQLIEIEAEAIVSK